MRGRLSRFVLPVMQHFRQPDLRLRRDAAAAAQQGSGERAPLFVLRGREGRRGCGGGGAGAGRAGAGPHMRSLKGRGGRALLDGEEDDGGSVVRLDAVPDRVRVRVDVDPAGGVDEDAAERVALQDERDVLAGPHRSGSARGAEEGGFVAVVHVQVREPAEEPDDASGAARNQDVLNICRMRRQ